MPLPDEGPQPSLVPGGAGQHGRVFGASAGRGSELVQAAGQLCTHTRCSPLGLGAKRAHFPQSLRSTHSKSLWGVRQLRAQGVPQGVLHLLPYTPRTVSSLTMIPFSTDPQGVPESVKS